MHHITTPRDIRLASPEYARDLMLDLADRIVTHVQLTTDGMNKYPLAVEDAFGTNVDFAQLIKVYGKEVGGTVRYSPPSLTSIHHEMNCGTPDPAYISTSFVERSNLTVTMNMRRFTRLTNGFSKKMENHEHAFALFTMHYNYCRVHKTLRQTPAMAASLSEHVWSIDELVGLISSKV